MSEWRETTLGEICNFRRGHDLPKTKMKKGNYPVAGSNGIIGYHNEFTTQSPCITIGRSGNIGNPYIYKQNTWAHNTTLYIDNFKGTDPMFLYYYLQTLDLCHFGGGSAVPTLNRNHIHPISVYLPVEVIEQKAIADTLSCLDEKIESNNKINQTLEEMAQVIFKSWFVDFEPFGGEMPEDWKYGSFSDIVLSTLGGDWGKEEPTGNYQVQTYCIRGADIPEIKNGNKGKMPTRYILEKNYKSKKLVKGDIVVEISGGSPTQSTGRVAVITDFLLNRYNSGMICTNFCRAMKPKEGYSLFLYYYWQYKYDKKVFFSYENGTIGIKNLDLSSFLQDEEIILPTKKIIDDFDTICNDFFKMVYHNATETQTLTEIRNTLLPKLMSGEVRLPLSTAVDIPLKEGD